MHGIRRCRQIPFLSALVLGALLGCSSEKSGLESLRKAVEPGTPPPDTIPEMLEYSADLQIDLSEMAKLPVGVLYNDVTAGSGEEIAPGDTIEIMYQGWMPNGSKVDSAVAGIRVGAGDVLAGIDAALPGMKPGGKRKLILPPGLAFGSEGRDNVPPNTVLVYEVEVRAKLP